MSRPINEDDVIKIIRMMPPENGITAMIEQGIKQLPSAQRESCEYWDAESNYCTLNRPSAQPEIWIPVSERLPENDDEVLVTVEFKKHRFVYSGSYSKDVDGDSHWYSLWDEFRVGRAREKIIAWMPMPKPYEG